MEYGSLQRFEMLSKGFLLDTCPYYNLRGLVVLLCLRLWAVSLWVWQTVLVCSDFDRLTGDIADCRTAVLTKNIVIDRAGASKLGGSACRVCAFYLVIVTFSCLKGHTQFNLSQELKLKLFTQRMSCLASGTPVSLASRVSSFLSLF